MIRRFKKVLAAVLVILIAASCIPLGGMLSASASTFSDLEKGAVIQFGSYPQSRVKNSALKQTLNEKLASVKESDWTSYKYISGSGTWDDGNTAEGDFAKYYDIELQSFEKYRAVKITDYRPYLTGLKAGKNSSAVNENRYLADTVYFFKFEPLEWVVLDPATGLMVCKNIIDAQPYNNFITYYGAEYYGNTFKTYFASDYANSSVRSWLNGQFYDLAFVNAEKEDIVSCEKTNASAYSSRYDSKNTSDKVFLLSEEDVLNKSYGFSNTVSDDEQTRVVEGSDYAKCQGLYVTDIDHHLEETKSYWLLRTSYTSDCVEYVDTDGSIKNYCNSSQADIGIRPAINVSPNMLVDRSMTTFTYYVPTSSEDTKYSARVLWGISNFGVPSTKYNSSVSLAALSLCNMSEKSQSAAEEEMGLLGFKSCQSYNYASSSWKNDLKTPAVTFAYNTFKVGGNTKYVIAAVIRGTDGYLDSDIMSGMNELIFSKSFKQETDNVYANLTSYMTSVSETEGANLTSDNTVFFITGHSLGGAVASRLAADVQKKSLADEYGVFAYTFGSPKYSDVFEDSYSNIFNIYLLNDKIADANSICCYTDNDGNKMLAGGDRYGLDLELLKPSTGAINKIFGSLANYNGLSYNYHITATYLASLLENDPVSKGKDDNGKFNVSEIRCITGVTAGVYDSAGKLAGEIPATDGLKCVGGIYMFRNGNVCYVFASNGLNYSLKFSSAVTGTMNFKQSLFDANTNSITDTKEFENISLEIGKKINSNVLGSVEPKDTRLFVMREDGVNKEFEIGTDGTETSYVALKSVNVEKLTVNYKASKKLEYDVVSEDENYTVTFSSSDPEVATVDVNGNVTGIARGTATITCTVSDGFGHTVTGTGEVKVSFSVFQWFIWIFLLGFLWY